MSRGKRTDPAVAVLVMVMADLGFEPGMIAELAGVARGTVNDIILGSGPWSTTPESELTERTRIRVIQLIDSAAHDLGMKVLAKINEKTKTASVPELLSIAGAMIEIGKGDTER
jgi:hypothetical protein